MKILVTISHDTAEHVEVLGANPSYEDSFLHWNSINWKKLDTYKEHNRMDCREICNKGERRCEAHHWPVRSTVKMYQRYNHFHFLFLIPLPFPFPFIVHGSTVKMYQRYNHFHFLFLIPLPFPFPFIVHGHRNAENHEDPINRRNKKRYLVHGTPAYAEFGKAFMVLKDINFKEKHKAHGCYLPQHSACENMLYLANELCSASGISYLSLVNHSIALRVDRRALMNLLQLIIDTCIHYKLIASCRQFVALTFFLAGTEAHIRVLKVVPSTLEKSMYRAYLPCCKCRTGFPLITLEKSVYGWFSGAP
ncbi:hypothetical protein IEQ34_016512 [Dendrobium chrysotoxum]|uniref:Uncharacterized protein n=1 Tax=Dendrobium chrysotoxum TaxID=161865 RepID=A0AAV7GFT5_DENCH|nr:hypothetical protein IEQ34_016512 [Dendrobium chrysotoxum]